MKNKIIIGNWKMKLSVKESVELAKKLQDKSIKLNGEMVICPDFVSLIPVAKVIKKNKVKLGAQDMFYENNGAYTGEVSPINLKSVGCEYVIIGHSERRQYLKETDELINRKVKKCLENKLTPILCVSDDFAKQLKLDLKNIRIFDKQRIIVAYEPLWAIGTGKVITREQVLKTHQKIKEVLEKIMSPKIFKK